jgi:hypothetical protein
MPGENPEDAFTRINPSLTPFMMRDDGKLYESSSVVIFAHEFSHAHDQIFNYSEYREEKKNDDKSASHKRAITSQNKVAETKGETKRSETGDKLLMITDTK